MGGLSLLIPLIATLTTCNKTHSGVLPQLRTLKAQTQTSLWESTKRSVAGNGLSLETLVVDINDMDHPKDRIATFQRDNGD